jgi:catechol 2,3-dioxygenase-like lactoylglutathione lyase family enzyme
MLVEALDHVTIKASDVEESARFYEDVLGLRRGERPPFSFPGVWLYCGDRAVIHLIGGRDTEEGSGAVDHFAFRAGDVQAFLDRLAERGIAHLTRDAPGINLRQIFIEDPDGVMVEVNFPI